MPDPTLSDIDFKNKCLGSELPLIEIRHFRKKAPFSQNLRYSCEIGQNNCFKSSNGYFRQKTYQFEGWSIVFD